MNYSCGEGTGGSRQCMYIKALTVFTEENVDHIQGGTYAEGLTFAGSCIVTFSYNESQRDAIFLNFILVKSFTK